MIQESVIQSLLFKTEHKFVSFGYVAGREERSDRRYLSHKELEKYCDKEGWKIFHLDRGDGYKSNSTRGGTGEAWLYRRKMTCLGRVVFWILLPVGILIFSSEVKRALDNLKLDFGVLLGMQ